jgi:hypothetical protein
MAKRFAGGYKPDLVERGTWLEAQEIAALRAARGPELGEGAIIFGLLTSCDSLWFDPLVQPKSRIKPDTLRAAYLLGTPPWVLGTGRGLDITTLPELQPLAKARGSAQNPITIFVSAGLGERFGNRLAQVLGTPLVREINYGRIHPDKIADNPRSELFALPLSPLLLARAAAGKLRLLSALTTSREELVAAAKSMSAESFRMDYLPAALEALAVPASMGLFVSAKEPDDHVRALHASCVEAFAEPGDIADFHFVLPRAASLFGVGTLEQGLRQRLKAFSTA